MYALYKGNNFKEVMLLLVKKAREENLKVNIICANEEIVGEISKFLWNYNFPNWVENEEYFRENNIYVSVDIKNVEVIIIFDTALMDLNLDEELDLKNYTKIIIIGIQHRVEGLYWEYSNKKWNSLTKEQYYC